MQPEVPVARLLYAPTAQNRQADGRLSKLRVANTPERSTLESVVNLIVIELDDDVIVVGACHPAALNRVGESVVGPS